MKENEEKHAHILWDKCFQISNVSMFFKNIRCRNIRCNFQKHNDRQKLVWSKGTSESLFWALSEFEPISSNEKQQIKVIYNLKSPNHIEKSFHSFSDLSFRDSKLIFLGVMQWSLFSWYRKNKLLLKWTARNCRIIL